MTKKDDVKVVTEESWTAQMTGVHFTRVDDVPSQDYSKNA